MCEHCGYGPTCSVCGRDDRPTCDVCSARVDPGTGQTIADTIICEDCCKKQLTFTVHAEILPGESFQAGSFVLMTL